MSRRKILSGNWKMNFSPNDALDYFKKFQEFSRTASAKPSQHSWVVFPVAYCLTSEIQSAARSCGIDVGAQNIHWQDKGAFTGELSGTVLKSMGISWCLLGHSERRQFFGENEDHLAKRLEFATTSGMNTVYCIGETLQERETGKMEAVLKQQLKNIVDVFKKSANLTEKLSLAYEPVWAIGTGKTATPEQAEEAHQIIRNMLSTQVSNEVASKTSILYGGSVTADNAKTLLSVGDIDGVLVGGASLKPDQFYKIVTSV